MSFEVQTPLFEGPFDLLLFFIERDELDIHNIPIFKITNDFLSYIRDLESLNIEIASDFILVAAKLMKLKSRELLPRISESDEEEDEFSSKEALIAHLLEYRKLKTVLDPLRSKEESYLKTCSRGSIEKEFQGLVEVSDEVDFELQALSLYKLMNVYSLVMEKYDTEKNHSVESIIPYAYTVESQKEYLFQVLSISPKVSFIDLSQRFEEKIAIIFTFLAILELLQLGDIGLLTGEGFNDFYLLRKS